MITKNIVFLVGLSLLLGCAKAQVTVCTDSESLYQKANFPIGVAINIDEFRDNPTHQNIAHKQFNSFTAENIFKAQYLHPEEGFFDWREADTLAYFCASNHKRLHGHTLIWHEQLPAWIMQYQGSQTVWEQMFKHHIQTIVLHFKGKVASWDVVNEAFNEDGTLRNSIWKQHIGEHYIEKAFLYAEEADANVLLFYNDYNLESNPTKRNSVINYCNNLRQRGVKIDGIGLQMHVSIMFPSITQIAEAFQQVSHHTYKVHVSELDVSVNPLGKNITPTPQLFAEQADYAGKIVLQYKKIARHLQYGITIWGISDKDSWIRSYFNREDYPLLYDDNYVPKPIYCKLFDVL